MGVIQVIDALNAHVVAGLAEKGYPKLAELLNGEEGRILIGNRHTFEQQMPPRIIMIPMRTTFNARDTSRGTAPVTTNTIGYDAEGKRTLAVKTILVEAMTLECSCWGIAPDNEDESIIPLLDFRYTQALYHQLIASCQQLMPGAFTALPGIWKAVEHLSRVGREFVFGLTINIPVLEELEPSGEPGFEGEGGLEFAPSDVTANITDSMVNPDGTSGPGCEEP